MCRSSGGNQGEVESGVAGEMRLQSDHNFARDSRTACEWQSFVNNQTKLQEDFQFIFTAIATLGQDMDSLIDCSDVIPAPKPQNFGPTRFPPGKSNKDIEQAVSSCLYQMCAFWCS